VIMNPEELGKRFTEILHSLVLTFASNWDAKKFTQAMLVPMSYYSTLLADYIDVEKFDKLMNEITEKIKLPATVEEGYAKLILAIKLIAQAISEIEVLEVDITDEERIEYEAEIEDYEVRDVD